MVDIDGKQYRTLKRIRNKKFVSVSDLSDIELSHCDYLESHGFIESSDDFLGDSAETYHYAVESYKITEAGRAQIYTFASTFHKWWIPLAVSIASFVISIITLIKTTLL